MSQRTYEIIINQRNSNLFYLFILWLSARNDEGYEKWKLLFLSVDHIREQYGMKVLAYGHPKDNENKVHQVIEAPSMEKIQEAMQDSEIAKIRTDAGVNLDTQELVFLSRININLVVGKFAKF